MYDWNQNGKKDSFDSYVDYNLANSNRSSGGVSSDWWVMPLLATIMAVCPPLGFIILILMFIFK